MVEKTSLFNKIANFIVKFRWLFALIFAGLIILSAFMLPKTKVNYDLSSYLPKESQTTKAIEKMKSEFGDVGTANVLVCDISFADAQALQAELSNLSGVQSVAFDKSSNYNEEAKQALFIITISPQSAEESNKTIEKLVNYVKDKDAYLSGESVSSYYTKESTETEVLRITIIIGVIIVIILLLTSRSFFELILLIIVFGAAAFINMGTNFMLGEISFISNSIAVVLQLALAIDYSIIFLHRFLEERKNFNPVDSAKKSLAKAIPEILSSSLTTIAGLCALMFMQLSIGFDLGLALSKGILISLLSVIFLMPSLLVLFSKLIDKTKHRSFVPNVTKPVKKMLGARKILVPIFLCLIAVALTGQFFNNYSFDMNGSQKIRESQEKIAENFGTMNTLVVLVPKGNYEKERELTEFVYSYDLIDSATGLTFIEFAPGVTLNLTEEFTYSQLAQFGTALGINEQQAMGLYMYYIASNNVQLSVSLKNYKIMLIDLLEFIYNSKEQLIPLGLSQEMIAQFAALTDVRKNFESENYSRIIFNINGPAEGKETFDLIADLESKLGNYYDEFYLAGESVVNFEMNRTFPTDNLKVTFATLGFILIILLLTFKNFGLPLVLILTIQGGIWINFAVPALLGNPVIFIGYLIVCAIQMGATIDYAIILTNRFKELKNKIPDKTSAMAEAVNAVFPTILTSGTILTLAGFVLGIFASEPITSGLGLLLGWGTFISMLMVLFVLPPLLVVSDKITAKTNFPKLRRKQKDKEKTAQLPNDAEAKNKPHKE